MPSLKELQEYVEHFCDENEFGSSIEHSLLDLVSGLGDVSQEVLEASDYGESPSTIPDGIEEQVGDLFFSFLNVANYLEVDLEGALKSALERYQQEFSSSGPGEFSGGRDDFAG